MFNTSARGGRPKELKVSKGPGGQLGLQSEATDGIIIYINIEIFTLLLFWF